MSGSLQYSPRPIQLVDQAQRLQNYEQLNVPLNVQHPPIANDDSYCCGFICSLICFFSCGFLMIASISAFNSSNCDQFKDTVSFDNCENESQLNAQVQQKLSEIGGVVLFILLLAIVFTGYKLKLFCRPSLGEAQALLALNPV